VSLQAHVDPRAPRAIHEHRAQYDIGFFFYNGGGDSQDTAYKVSQMGAGMAYPIVCVGIPKTVDNACPLLTVHRALSYLALKMTALKVRLTVAPRCQALLLADGFEQRAYPARREACDLLSKRTRSRL
jgi:hypothetical protein